MNISAPSIPERAAPYIEAVVGLDDVDAPSPMSDRADAEVTGPATSSTPAGGPETCSDAAAAAEKYNSLTPGQVAAAYGFPSLYGSGDLAAGQNVALLEFQDYSASDVAAYQSCLGTDASVADVEVDGGPSANSGVDEADGDIEDVVGLAPDAKIFVYQAPGSSSGWLDAWNAVVSQDEAKVISISWGMCEPLSSVNVEAENTLLEQAAVQGETVLAAAGDSGSEDCLGPDGANNYLAVDDPGSQPFVTDVGGTQWASVGGPPGETVWNDGVIECAGSSDCFGAGGGGISTNWTMPSYQLEAASSLGVIGAHSSGDPCGAPAGSYCRQVPDVSALAGPHPYLFYVDGTWEAFGGTSFAASTWAALISLTDASSWCDGGSVGFVNPLLYSVAGSAEGALNEVTAGDNDISGANGGLYRASPGYSMAAGLGTPNASVLTPALCDGNEALAAVQVRQPSTQKSYVGETVNLSIGVMDQLEGSTLSFSAVGLPPGLSISASTGVVSGAPTTSGSFAVTVTVEDTGRSSGSASFSWSVVAPATAGSGSREPGTDGYWLVGSDGGVYSFGDASFYGSVPQLGIHLSDIVGMAAAPDGAGYWLVGSDGGVYSFDAPFCGSMGATTLNEPVVVMVPAASPSTCGYWLAASDGGIFSLGESPFEGSVPGDEIHVSDIKGMTEDSQHEK